MKTIIIVCVMMVCVVGVHAKDVKYPVNAIPQALKENASAVVREDETVFRIISRNKSNVHYHLVVTILNSKGSSYAVTTVFYDKLIKIKDLKATVYNAGGETIKKLKSSDILDRAMHEGLSSFSDNRYKAFDLTQSEYPYTVDVEYDLDYDYLYPIDGSTIGTTEYSSVENFKYQLIYPLEFKPRYRTFNIDGGPVTAIVTPGIESMTWSFQNVPTTKREPMTTNRQYYKQIEAAPGLFEVSGYSGDMSSWEEFGKWLNKLGNGRDKLPEAAKRKVHELTSGLKTNEEKARVLYEYLQSKTRYVSIQLGIGGWQPFEASVVDETGYGDCKALSNYMVAMLKEAGVRAHYTVINSGEDAEGFDPAFPTNRANHIIVAVPNEKDTLWLECTSQTIPFGFLGTHTDNRYGLMLTENGGKLARTTYYSPEKNLQLRVADVVLDGSGNAKAKVTTSYSGLQYENGGLFFYLTSTPDNQKKWIQTNTQIPNFDVGQFSITNKKDIVPTATVKMDLTLNKFASVTNKRIFMTPNLMNRLSSIPEKVENRKTSFVIDRGYIDIDTIKYRVPENLYPEFLPANTKLESRFGSYESGYKLDAGSVIYFRKLIKKDGEYPAESYKELIEFYKNINKADNTKLVLLSKT